MFTLVFSTPTVTQLSRGIPNADMQLAMVVKSSSAVPPFDTHVKEARLHFPEVDIKIRTGSGFILRRPLSLEPSVAREMETSAFALSKRFWKKMYHRNRIKPSGQLYIVQISVCLITMPTYNRVDERDCKCKCKCKCLRNWPLATLFRTNGNKQ